MDSHHIPIRIDDIYGSLADDETLARIAQDVLRAENAPSGELSIYITDDETVQSLNRRYLGLDEPTDVLSFSLAATSDSEGFPSTEEEENPLGEVVISYPTAERQAREEGHPIQAELAHLLVHGILHILGYDHELPEDETRMRQREALKEVGHD
jgi:probable rRNA maturation factor